MHLKSLGWMVCVVNSFLNHLQSNGQATQKIILGPIKHQQQTRYGINMSWATWCMYKHSTNLNRQPANTTPLPWWAASFSAHSQDTRATEKQFSSHYFIWIKSTLEEQHSTFCLVFEWQGKRKNKTQRKTSRSVCCPPEENQMKLQLSNTKTDMKLLGTG